MRTRLLFLGTLLVSFLIFSATADTGVPVTAETQGISSETLVNNLGLTTETDAIMWQESNWVMYANLVRPLSPPLYPVEHSLYTTSYQEETLADQGLTSYTKTISLDTRDKVANQFNFETEKIVAYSGAETGLLTTDESLLLDVAGTPHVDWGLFICPFAGSPGETWNPAFCNIVEMGSGATLHEGMLTTGTEERHVMAATTSYRAPEFWPYPISDPGVEENYYIRISGIEGSSPAVGNADVYINAHIMEGRLMPLPTGPSSVDQCLAEDIVYNEMTTASGAIDLFQKSMTYTSKITGRGFTLGPPFV